MIVNKIILILLFIIPLSVQAHKLNDEKMCLAANIYFESKGETLLGQIKVAQVTMNRVNSEKWPNTICGVVKQKKQFSWYKGQKSFKHYGQPWDIALAVATAFINGAKFPNDNSVYFLNRNIAKHTKWTNKLKFTERIGNHWFYAEKN